MGCLILHNLLFWCFLIGFQLISRAKSEDTCDIDIENTLRSLLAPQRHPSIQLQAIRRDVLRKFQEALDKTGTSDEQNYKRSFASLAAHNDLPLKRNLEALARAGYIRTLPDNVENDTSLKRSIASLAKSGQLLQRNDNQKRNMPSSGEFYQTRDNPFDEIPDDQTGMTNFYKLEQSGRRPYWELLKRNIATIVREGKLPGKRNVAALLRQDNYLNSLYGRNEVGTENPQSDKRNIASIKAQYKNQFKRSVNSKVDRTKREVDYFDDEELSEFPSPSRSGYEYEDLIRELNSAHPNNEKRFLGSVARSGWFRPSSSSRFYQPDKRHIGSLARLGWLPTFRNVRRFNRSGRSTDSDDSCRQTSKYGKTQNDSVTKFTLPLDPKRFLLQDKIISVRHPKVTHYF